MQFAQGWVTINHRHNCIDKPHLDIIVIEHWLQVSDHVVVDLITHCASTGKTIANLVHGVESDVGRSTSIAPVHTVASLVIDRINDEDVSHFLTSERVDPCATIHYGSPILELIVKHVNPLLGRIVAAIVLHAFACDVQMMVHAP